jgi:hypothetical protein
MSRQPATTLSIVFHPGEGFDLIDGLPGEPPAREYKTNEFGDLVCDLVATMFERAPQFQSGSAAKTAALAHIVATLAPVLKAEVS